MDKPWFVHRRRRGRWELRPHAWQGWAITALFALTVVAISAILGWPGVPAPDRWIAFGALMTAALGGFLLTALRNAAPIAERDDGKD